MELDPRDFEAELEQAKATLQVNVIAYSQLRPDQNNKASSLTNLFRNWGGQLRRIAFISTSLDRRHELHQSNLGSSITATSKQFGERVSSMANYFVQHGFTGPDALVHAQGRVYQQLQRQVNFLSFMDCFRVIAWVTLAALPLLFLLRKVKAAGAPPAAH